MTSGMVATVSIWLKRFKSGNVAGPLAPFLYLTATHYLKIKLIFN